MNVNYKLNLSLFNSKCAGELQNEKGNDKEDEPKVIPQEPLTENVKYESVAFAGADLIADMNKLQLINPVLPKGGEGEGGEVTLEELEDEFLRLYNEYMSVDSIDLEEHLNELLEMALSLKELGSTLEGLDDKIATIKAMLVDLHPEGDRSIEEIDAGKSVSENPEETEVSFDDYEVLKKEFMLLIENTQSSQISEAITLYTNLVVLLRELLNKGLIAQEYFKEETSMLDEIITEVCGFGFPMHSEIM